MSHPALTPKEVDLIATVFRKHPAITCVRLFGSRAKGTHQPHSDVDFAVWGDVNAIQAEAIAAELDELPLPYHFDVQPFRLIMLPALRDHIERVGINVYSQPEPSAGTTSPSGCRNPQKVLG